ncbi:uncharacterized protein LOC117773092 [Xyrichtys novacula]|uniref:Uncharacterized protein LOC117773092 n=1 Tax=Xyrichtys novacula TaxID=13765 RepID=A0AAV1FW27_XYRNO|nr:uncharacterized protein LOC117773092 [Xyrichtys novacula]
MPRFYLLLSLWPSSASYLLLVGLLGGQLGLRVGFQVVQTLTCSRRDTLSSQSIFQDGDVVIGGLFPLHLLLPAIENDFTQLPVYPSCTGLLRIPGQYAMTFAVEEINNSTTLLPGVKLGYHILDSCSRPPWALQAALTLVGGDSSSCNSASLINHPGASSADKPVPLIIGGAATVTSKVLSKILEPLSVPLMSYSASCPCLSDRTQYPNFFRTVPSDFYQARAMAQLAIRFKWTWIGAVVVNNDYGLTSVKVFQEETAGKEVCLAFVETLRRERTVSDARRAALTIQASTARVILVFAWHIDVTELFLQLAEINVTDRQFLASEAWSTSTNLFENPVTSKVASGVIGVAYRSSTIPGFENYLRSLNPLKRPDDKFLREFWVKEFGCSPDAKPQTPSEAYLPPCSGSESLERVQNHFTEIPQLRVTYNVYLAVYAAAHALHSLLSCPNRDNSSSTCFKLKHIKPTELLQQMSKVNFTSPQGEMLYFQGGEIPAKYDLVNWQKTPEGSLKLTLFGRVDGFDLHLNESAVQWSTGSNQVIIRLLDISLMTEKKTLWRCFSPVIQVPVSVCSESCPPGTRKANRKGEPLCCFDCFPCAEGEISNKTGSTHCERCPPEFWSNPERTACIPRQLDFLSFNETLGITLTTAAVSGVVVTSAVFVVFLYYRHTPMVRANNSELSFLLLLSLKLCFLCSLVFIGRPSVWSCRFQQAAFGISFVLCVSCLQVKTIVVLAAFRSARPGAEALIRWFGPVPQADLKVPGLTVTLKCAMASVVGFSLVLGYIGLLACTCLLLAFLARKLPDNFNEAKLITFSMLIFCAVWVAFVPAYVSSPGNLLRIPGQYAMTFAVEEINNSTTLLPGVKLGYHILDSCSRPPWALQAALTLVGGNSSSCTLKDTSDLSTIYREENRESRGDPPVPLMIGGTSSVAAKTLSGALAPLSVPLISFSASCPCLSDRHQFPNFFRTIPSDTYQARAMAQLAIRFKWTWIGAVVANNDYGLNAVKAFQEETEGKGVCLAFVEAVKRESIESDVRRAALTIQASTVKVILVFFWSSDLRKLFEQLYKLNVTDRQFLASEAWSTNDRLLKDPLFRKVGSGVLGVAIRSSAIPGFENYLKNLNPMHRPNDEFLREFWQNEFECIPNTTPPSSYATPTPSHANRSITKTSLPPCSGTESLERLKNHFHDTSQLRAEYNIYIAVYAAAHALHSLLSCPDIDSSPRNKSSTCSSVKPVKPIELLQHLNKVNFTTLQGERFYFQGADILPKYDLVNWQKTPDGSQKLVLIGHIDGLDLFLNESAIQWSTGSNQVPVSVCSESCPPGTRKANRKGEPLCCFDCFPCAEGEISNKTGSPHCEQCPPEFWSNPERTVCIPRQLDFLSFNETLGITLTTAAVSGVVVTSAVFVVFLHYRHTPVVRANNSELSFLLLLSLKLCFLCSLVFIGRPTVWSCRFQQAAFGISFVLCVSCLQVKTIVVLAAFRSARPGAEALIRWFGPGQQRGSVCLLTCVQIIICSTWLSLSPPEPRRDLGFQGLKVTLECAMASVVGFSLVLGYIGLLACTCLLLAFLARKLPDNFNEAKLITFSMLIFCAVWVAFVPAYVSSPGKYTVAVEIFAILASSYGLLLCIFAPKCFIILLRPEKNTKKSLMAR